MKKLILAPVTALVLALALTGCGDNHDHKNSDNTTPTNTASASATTSPTPTSIPTIISSGGIGDLPGDEVTKEPTAPEYSEDELKTAVLDVLKDGQETSTIVALGAVQDQSDCPPIGIHTPASSAVTVGNVGAGVVVAGAATFDSPAVAEGMMSAYEASWTDCDKSVVDMEMGGVGTITRFANTEFPDIEADQRLNIGSSIVISGGMSGAFASNTVAVRDGATIVWATRTLDGSASTEESPEVVAAIMENLANIKG